MKYTQFTQSQIQHALGVIGVQSVDELFAPIPRALRLKNDLNIPSGLSELELLDDARSLASLNRHCDELVCFLGGGAAPSFWSMKYKPFR